MAKPPGQRVSTCCWDAYAAYDGTAETLATLWQLVRDGELLKKEWSAQFVHRDDGSDTLPPLMCLLPLAATDPNDPDFRVRIDMVRHLVATTTYAAEVIMKHLDVPTLRRTAKARTGKCWPNNDPLVKMLSEVGVINIVPKKKKTEKRPNVLLPIRPYSSP